ncbi:MAG: type 2 lantipeptide synthetase LanM [Lactobacillales bacterium]|nr:type 2 lantipeptide synthetase LanM [Lactobacillales bacterium]
MKTAIKKADISSILLKMQQKAMTMMEKRKYYSAEDVSDNVYFEEWKRIKSLVCEERLDEVLKFLQISKEEFKFLVSPLNKTDIKFQKWILLFKEIMDFYQEIKDEKNYSESIVIAISPFVHSTMMKVKKIFAQISSFIFSKQAFNKIIESYIQELTSLISKIIVIELELYKDQHTFVADDAKEQFSEFIKAFFDSPDAYWKFYEKYAACTRVLVTRTAYFLKNLEFFVEAVHESKKEIADFLANEIKEIVDLSFLLGDSHDQGKSVVVVEFNEHQKIVFKPRNLEVCYAFKQFLHWCNENSGLLDIKIPKGIYKENYSFVQFIEHQTCRSEKEVSKYYERFGYLLALAYVFCITDLHSENLIAHECYPFLIDIETIFHSPARLSGVDEAESKMLDAEMINDLVKTSLLPIVFETDPHKKKGILDLSGLTGDEQQKSEKKFIQPVNIGRVDFHFKLKPVFLNTTQNIPLVNDEKVNPANYRVNIVQGFESMLCFLEKNKKRVLEELDFFQLFARKKIRCLMKTSQKYGSLLLYADHPNYAENMIKREELLWNLWSYLHKNLEIIDSEYKDLLFNDIPIFYSYTDSKDVFDSRGKRVKNYYQETGLQKVVGIISNLSEKTIQKQMGLLMANLDIFVKNELGKKDIRPFNFLREAENIATSLWESRFQSKDELSFITVISILDQRYSVVAINSSLYEGLAGVALFYLELYLATKEEKYLEYYRKILKNTMRKTKGQALILSAYYGVLSQIFPLLLEAKILKNQDAVWEIKKFINLIANYEFKDSVRIDWLSGLAGVLGLVSEVYLVLKIDEALQVADLLSQKLLLELEDSDKDELNEHGVAHGLSGLALSLAKYYRIKPSESLKQKIIGLLEKEMDIYQTKQQSLRFDCGSTGMLAVRLYINGIFQHSKIKEQIATLSSSLEGSKKDDSLYQGNAGVIYALFEYQAYDKSINETVSKGVGALLTHRYLQGEYDLQKIPGFVAKGVFTGLAGVGLAFLRLSGYEKNNDVLLLDVGKFL